MKVCKYNDFQILFTKDEMDLGFPDYDIGVWHTIDIPSPMFYYRTRQKIVFNSPEKNQFLGNYKKFIVADYGVNKLNLLWTSFEGKSEIYKVKSEESFYDYLLMSFAKKKQKVLYFGEDYRFAIAAWRNQINLDFLFNVTPEQEVIDKFLKSTQETYLPF